MENAEQLFYENVAWNSALSARRGKPKVKRIEWGIQVMRPKEVTHILKDKYGIEISEVTLRLWARQGMLSQPRTDIPRQGRGKITDYPDEVIPEAATAYILSKEFRQRQKDIAQAREDARFVWDESLSQAEIFEINNNVDTLGRTATRDHNRNLWVHYYLKVKNGIPLDAPAEVSYGFNRNEDGSITPSVQIRPSSQKSVVFEVVGTSKNMPWFDVPDDDESSEPGIFDYNDDEPEIYQAAIVETDQEREVRKQAGIEAARRRMEARQEREARNANPTEQ